jgi:hypothetical protein
MEMKFEIYLWITIFFNNKILSFIICIIYNNTSYIMYPNPYIISLDDSKISSMKEYSN